MCVNQRLKSLICNQTCKESIEPTFKKCQQLLLSFTTDTCRMNCWFISPATQPESKTGRKYRDRGVVLEQFALLLDHVVQKPVIFCVSATNPTTACVVACEWTKKEAPNVLTFSHCPGHLWVTDFVTIEALRLITSHHRGNRLPLPPAGTCINARHSLG